MSGIMFASAMSIPCAGPTESTIEEDYLILPPSDADDSIMDTSPILGSWWLLTEGALEEGWLHSLQNLKSVAIKHTPSSDSFPCGTTTNAQDVQQEYPQIHWERRCGSVALSSFMGLSFFKELDKDTTGRSEDATMQALSENTQALGQPWKRAAAYEGAYEDQFIDWANIVTMMRGRRETVELLIKEKELIERELKIYVMGEWRIRLDKRSKDLKALFDFWNILWGLLDTIIELMQTLRVYIVLVLNTASSGFSEFPNSMRPPCTTMPWTIWPSLVVLWGVCWMFHTPLNPARECQFQLSLQDAEWMPFSNSEVPFEPLEAPFLTNQDISEHSTLGGLNSLPDSFDWSNEIDFIQFSASGNHQKVDVAPIERAAPYRSLERGVSSSFTSSTDFIWAGNIVQQHPVTIPSDNHLTVPSPIESLATALGTGASTQAEQNALPSKPSITSMRLKQPPRNSDDVMICDHVDCNNQNIIFTTIHEWSKHKNKHERPYKCTVKDCTRTQGFATKGDQLRHERAVHTAPNSGVNTQGSTSTLLFCDEPSCARGPGTGNAGFHRRDNLMDHVKRRHGRGMALSRVTTMGVGGVSNPTRPDNQSPALPQLDDQAMISSLALPGKLGRVPATQTLDTVDFEDTNPRKKQRRDDGGSNNDAEQTLRERALTLEVEKLRKELEKSQREKDVLIGVIDRLTRDRE